MLRFRCWAVRVSFLLYTHHHSYVCSRGFKNELFFSPLVSFTRLALATKSKHFCSLRMSQQGPGRGGRGFGGGRGRGAGDGGRDLRQEHGGPQGGGRGGGRGGSGRGGPPSA